MSLDTRALVLVLAAGIGQLLAGCQANTPDHLDFALGDLTFAVPSSRFPSSPPGGLRPLVCAGPLALTSDCCTPPAPEAAIDCQQYPVACDPIEKLCALIFTVAVTTKTNLVERVAALAAVDGRVFASMSLVGMTTELENDADLPLRGASLYIGPAGLGSPSSPAAQLLAQIPLVEDATTPIELSAEAQQAFSRFARDYRTTFSWLLAAQVVVRPGSSPSGTATFTVRARAEAWY